MINKEKCAEYPLHKWKYVAVKYEISCNFYIKHCRYGLDEYIIKWDDRL